MSLFLSWEDAVEDERTSKCTHPTFEVPGCGWRGKGEAETAPTGCMKMTDDVILQG